MRKIVFEQEISNQEANLIRMDVEVEAVENDDAEDSDFQTDSNSELEEEESNHFTCHAKRRPKVDFPVNFTC